MPEVSFPEAERKFLLEEYRNAPVILEYGSGGSTILASELPGKRVFSVESDRDWALRLQARIEELDPPSPATVHHVDIGPTGDWGRPIGPESWPLFFHYPLDIWQQPFFRHPDLVLIDGRFRVACLATVGLLCSRPVRVLFDDYRDRPRYHRVEHRFPRSAMVGRMAVFDVVPGQLKMEDFPFILELFSLATYHGRPSPYKDAV